MPKLFAHTDFKTHWGANDAKLNLFYFFFESQLVLSVCKALGELDESPNLAQPLQRNATTVETTFPKHPIASLIDLATTLNHLRVQSFESTEESALFPLLLTSSSCFLHLLRLWSHQMDWSLLVDQQI